MATEWQDYVTRAPSRAATYRTESFWSCPSGGCARTGWSDVSDAPPTIQQPGQILAYRRIAVNPNPASLQFEAVQRYRAEGEVDVACWVAVGVPGACAVVPYGCIGTRCAVESIAHFTGSGWRTRPQDWGLRRGMYVLQLRAQQMLCEEFPFRGGVYD
jgi:hypothetical protein